ncbi:MAG: hypothetical protein ACP5NP_10155 [Acetobacteraceae bacterium]
MGGHGAALASGAADQRAVGPTYGFFGLRLAPCFASQGAGRLCWPVAAGLLRLVVAVGLGFVALRLTGSLTALYLALAVYGLTIAAAVGSGSWFRRARLAPVRAVG